MRLVSQRSILAIVALVFHAFSPRPALADSPSSPLRLPRTNLLVFHATGGEVAAVRSQKDWQRRRAEIVKGMEEIMGPLPGKEKRCALETIVEEEVDCGSYLRRFVTYASEPGSRVPAYLLIPNPALA